MYTEPKIITSNSLKTRSYITFYFNGKRVREFNGHRLNLNINPNHTKSIQDRDRLLEELRFKLKNALKNNSYPAVKPDTVTPLASTLTVLMDVLNRKLDSDLSDSYKTDLRSIYNHFMEFLTDAEKIGSITEITLPRIELFLTRYNSSGTYYMNKRRTLGVLFNSVGKTIQKTIEVVRETSVRRTTSKLHRIYEREQLLKILDYLKTHHFNLYLCCLISYGCFLRPHQEVRLLKGVHFKNDFREIHLSGSENKGRKVRVVYVPDYVRSVLQLIPGLLHDTNLFTLSTDYYNPSYFNTAWSRAWKNMYKQGLVQKNHTIYSFRHTAAVDVFRRTKDIYLLQKLLGHSTIVVTLRYLRGLGEYNSEELRDAAPRL
ncbi:tyrosine-type recombinase/integrase [Daejeonella oryzae]|uniref:tyrosine-type recombinase/integrase n=1 Tax=Daejeonella oryzae TaxID=1122943 RepID=UPI0003FA3010|nr:tyrosine-type recombinase/integrase [Daejeonella oryzae]